MDELSSYIRKVTGLEVKVLEYPANVLQRLPMFIREGYDFLWGEFHEHFVVFAWPKLAAGITPGRLQRDIPKIETAFDCPAILVLGEMAYYLKEKLIESRISFILPGKQLFIPFMFMDLSEQRRTRIIRPEHFSPSTQCVLIYHLWVGSLEELNFQQIAELFTYTPRTIGRCAEELKNAGICRIIGSKSKHLEFGESKKVVWEKALDYLVSPVKEMHWLENEPVDMTTYKLAGISALSNYSNVSSGKIDTFAMDSNRYRVLKNTGDVDVIMDNEVGLQLQIWNYDPVILSKNNIVDPLSLYLSLQNDPDERVQMELESMLAKVLQ